MRRSWIYNFEHNYVGFSSSFMFSRLLNPSHLHNLLLLRWWSCSLRCHRSLISSVWKWEATGFGFLEMAKSVLMKILSLLGLQSPRPKFLSFQGMMDRLWFVNSWIQNVSTWIQVCSLVIYQLVIFKSYVCWFFCLCFPVLDCKRFFRVYGESLYSGGLEIKETCLHCWHDFRSAEHE